MRVHGYRSWRIGGGDEDYLGGFDRVVIGEAEAEAEGQVEVDGVGIEDLDVHLPFREVRRGGKSDARREASLEL